MHFLALFGKISVKFGANLASKFKKLMPEPHAPFSGAIWDEFSEQHYHQSIKKSTKFDDQLALFWCK